MLDIGEAAAVAVEGKPEMGVGQPGQQGDRAADGKRDRHRMAGLGDCQAEHGEYAAADHAADADGGDFGEIELARGCAHCRHIPWPPTVQMANAQQANCKLRCCSAQ